MKTMITMSVLTIVVVGVVVATGQAPVVAQDQGAETVAAPTGRAATPAAESGERVRSIRRNEYFYQSYGRRDLFSALVSGEFEPNQGAEIVDVNTSRLVGVMWGPTDRFALVEDDSENGFILRVGDRVQNGRVLAIQEESLVASISLYGITSRVILRLEDGKDQR